MDEPPLVLVQTWYALLDKGNDKDVASHAQEMLLGAFENEYAIAAYFKKHKIID
jgi:hypothetical protein